MNKRSPVIHRLSDGEEGRAMEVLARAAEDIDKLSRRKFLSLAALAAAGWLLPRFPDFAPGAVAGEPAAPKAAMGRAVETGLFIFPRLRFSVIDNTTDLWNAHPEGDANLKAKLAEVSNIHIRQEPKIVRLADFDDMVRHPFVFMTSEGDFNLPPDERRNLREFLERGGFVLADDCVYRERDIFFQCYRRHIDGCFPDNPMREIPRDHEVFHCYYDFPNGVPHMQGIRFRETNALGLFERETGRLMSLATPADIHCGWVCQWFNTKKNLDALKMGINIIVYFLSH